MQEKDNKNKVPLALKAAIEARREAEENMKAAMQPSRQIAEMMRQIKREQQVYDDMIRPLKNIYTSEMRQMMNFSNSAVKVLNQYRQEFDTANMFKSIIKEQREAFKFFDSLKPLRQAFDAASMFKSIIEEQRDVQKRIVEALKPTFQVQRSIALELSRMNSWQDTFKSMTDSLKDFRPAVEVLRDALVIEDEEFSQEDINQIAEEYIWDENNDKNIFKQDSKGLSWESIPKPIRWLVALIFVTIFNIYLTAIWKEATKSTALNPERVARQLVHFRKQDVREINKNHQSDIYSPFVNTENLIVYTVPKKRSQIIAVLSYPREIKLLKFKNKKHWVFIEWTDEANEVYQGWVLGRYIYRKNTSKSK